MDKGGASTGKPAGTVTQLPGRPIIRYGWAALATRNGELALQTMMYDRPKVDPAVGGWDTIERKRRRSITEYKGGPGMSMTLALIFEGFKTKESVEGDIRTLEALGRPAAGEAEPPEIVVNGNGAIPHDVWNDPEVTWVIQSIEEQDGTEWHYAERIRALFVVNLIEYSPDDLKIRGPHHHKKRKRLKTYVLKKGDTLMKIAARKDVYGDAHKWKRIAKANHIRDPHHPGKPGKRIKIP